MICSPSTELAAPRDSARGMSHTTPPLETGLAQKGVGVSETRCRKTTSRAAHVLYETDQSIRKWSNKQRTYHFHRLHSAAYVTKVSSTTQVPPWFPLCRDVDPPCQLPGNKCWAGDGRARRACGTAARSVQRERERPGRSVRGCGQPKGAYSSTARERQVPRRVLLALRDLDHARCGSSFSL